MTECHLESFISFSNTSLMPWDKAAEELVSQRVTDSVKRSCTDFDWCTKKAIIPKNWGGGERGWFCKSSFLNLRGESANSNKWCFWCGTFFSILFMRLTISSLIFDIVGGQSNQESLRSLASGIVMHSQSKQNNSNPLSFSLLLCNFFHAYPEWDLGRKLQRK